MNDAASRRSDRHMRHCDIFAIVRVIFYWTVTILMRLIGNRTTAVFHAACLFGSLYSWGGCRFTPHHFLSLLRWIRWRLTSRMAEVFDVAQSCAANKMLLQLQSFLLLIRQPHARMAAAAADCKLQRYHVRCTMYICGYMCSSTHAKLLTADVDHTKQWVETAYITHAHSSSMCSWHSPFACGCLRCRRCLFIEIQHIDSMLILCTAAGVLDAQITWNHTGI